MLVTGALAVEGLFSLSGTFAEATGDGEERGKGETDAGRFWSGDEIRAMKARAAENVCHDAGGWVNTAEFVSDADEK